jgi:hypothetical protein
MVSLIIKSCVFMNNYVPNLQEKLMHSKLFWMLPFKSDLKCFHQYLCSFTNRLVFFVVLASYCASLWQVFLYVSELTMKDILIMKHVMCYQF